MHQMNLIARGFVSIDFERKILGYNPFEEDLEDTNSPPKEPKVPVCINAKAPNCYQFPNLSQTPITFNFQPKSKIPTRANTLLTPVSR